MCAVVVPSPGAEFLSPSFGAERRQEQNIGSTGGVGGTKDGFGNAAAAGAMWSCQHCTFHNDQQLQACDMCGLPRQ